MNAISGFDFWDGRTDIAYNISRRAIETKSEIAQSATSNLRNYSHDLNEIYQSTHDFSTTNVFVHIHTVMAFLMVSSTYTTCAACTQKIPKGNSIFLSDRPMCNLEKHQ